VNLNQIDLMEKVYSSYKMDHIFMVPLKMINQKEFVLLKAFNKISAYKWYGEKVSLKDMWKLINDIIVWEID
jgi:hypothetical protein